MNQLIKQINANLKPKIVQGKILNGRMLLNIAWEYINCFNTNEKPLINESINNVISSEARKIKDDITEEFDEQVEECLNEQSMPYEEEVFIECHSTLSQKMVTKFENKVKNLANYDLIYKLKAELQDQIKEDYEERLDINNNKSSYLCSKIIDQFQASFVEPRLSNKENLDINPVNVLSDLQEYFFDTFYSNYLDYAKGKFKCFISFFLGLIVIDEKIVEFIPNFLFKTFDSLLYQAMNYYQREIRGFKSQIDDYQITEKQIQEKLKEKESLLFQIQNEKENQQRQFQKEIREYQKQIAIKDSELENFKKIIQDRDEEIENFEKKIQSLKETVFKKEGEIGKHQMSMVAQRRQILQLNAKANKLDTVYEKPTRPGSLSLMMENISLNINSIRNSIVPTSLTKLPTNSNEEVPFSPIYHLNLSS